MRTAADGVGTGRTMTGPISRPLLRRTWRAQRSRVALVVLALAVWAFLMPVIYATFGRQMDVAPRQPGSSRTPFLRLLGADPFSLDGAVALGWSTRSASGSQVALPGRASAPWRSPASASAGRSRCSCRGRCRAAPCSLTLPAALVLGRRS